MEEIWKDIKGYEGKYQVSNLGNVKSLNYKKQGFQKLLTPEISYGYPLVQLYDKKGNRRRVRIHRLVAEAFVNNPNPDKFNIINHIDENKLNNLYTNLEWCDKRHNSKYTGHWKAVYCFDLDMTFESIQDAAVHTKISRNAISKACSGHRLQAGGMLWCYAEEKDIKFNDPL